LFKTHYYFYSLYLEGGDVFGLE